LKRAAGGSKVKGRREEGAGRRAWWRSVKRWCEDGRGCGIDGFLDLCCEEEKGELLLVFTENTERRKNWVIVFGVLQIIEKSRDC